MFVRTLPIFLAFALGCGHGSPPSPPRTYPARGTIAALDARPLKHVVINLEPFNPSSALAQGVVNDRGEFVLRTFAPDDGAMPGKYKLWLRPAPDVPRKASLIPLKYRSAEDSDVTVLIASENNELSIRLK